MESELGGLNVHRERRRQLIERLRNAGITDLAILHAFDRVPRHLFVPPIFEARAYGDEALPLGHGQTISRPSTHASFLQALNLQGDERVLEVGTGSGFQTALLATLCHQVFSIERVPELALAARERIDQLGFSNVLIRAGDGSYGWRRYAPFHAILITAAVRQVPQPLFDQLRPHGRLLAPLEEQGLQQLHQFVRREDGSLDDKILGGARFVRLHGDSGVEPKSGETHPW